MSRYIDANKLIERLMHSPLFLLAPKNSKDGIIDLIVHQPTADVVEVRHGEWETPTTIKGREFNVPHCSVCDGIPCGVDENTKYCPNCGAKMDGERRDTQCVKD